MATQQLGEMGPGESAPVLVAWHWYYNLPALPPWILLALVAVIPRHNWNRQAWLVLLLPIAVGTLLLLVQLALPDVQGIHALGCFWTTLAIAWACVFLLGRWWESGRPGRSALVALGVMAIVGLVGYYAYCGFWFSPNVTWNLFALWLACSIPLVTSAALTGLCCRGHVNAARLLLWPLLWLPVGCFLSVAILVACMMLLAGIDNLSMAAIFLVQFLVLLPILAGTLYVLNVPVAMVCALSPVYRQRFADLFCRGGQNQERGGLANSNPFGEMLTTPDQEPVGSADES